MVRIESRPKNTYVAFMVLSQEGEGSVQFVVSRLDAAKIGLFVIQAAEQGIEFRAAEFKECEQGGA